MQFRLLGLLLPALALQASASPLLGERGTGSGAPAAELVDGTGSEETSPRVVPELPALVAPADGAADIPAAVDLVVNVTDPDGGPLNVTFFGRPSSASVSDFSIVVLPDTQNYSEDGSGIYRDQTEWIVDNLQTLNIVYVAHLGDCVENADFESEWLVADDAMSVLEDPITTNSADGIPYGMVPGNHDQFPLGDPGTFEDEGSTTGLFNQYFGVSRFSGRAYYGDHYGINNDNHYDLFSAAGMDFIVVYLEFNKLDEPLRQAELAWADSVLQLHSARRAIVVSHSILLSDVPDPVSFSSQGQAIYDALKANPNLFLMLCGHLSNEGTRQDVFDGHTVDSLLSNYQGRANGGNGWLRILEFSPDNDEIRVKTYSPFLDQYEIDANSEFVRNYDMDGEVPFTEIGTIGSVPSGETASISWTGRKAGATYEWWVRVDDGTTQTVGPTWTFTSDGSCADVADCQDEDPCVEHACTAGFCEDTINPFCCTSSSECADRDPCTDDICVDNSCQNNPVICDDGNPCTDDMCDPVDGCVGNIDDTNVCDDGLSCTTNDHCSAGLCVGDDLCPDGELCGASGTCEVLVGDELPISAGENWRYFKGMQEPPSDWNTRTFQHSSWLEGPSGFGYEDDDDATVLLDMEGNYVSLYIRHLFEVPDADSLYGVALSVNYDDAFVAYINGTEVARSDNIIGTPPLHTDEATSGHEAGIPEIVSLDSQLGLLVSGVNVLAVQGHNRSPGSSDFSLLPELTINCAIPDVPCEDGSVCTENDICDSSGACTPGPSIDCDDADLCTVDSCDPVLGCVYTVENCDDGDPCTSDSCDPSQGCLHAPDPGVGCEDGDACTMNDTCDAGGVCVGGAPADCNDDKLCTIDSCDPATGCTNTPDVGASCDDQNACTENDTCGPEGICVGGPPPDCDDANGCTIDSCDSVQGCIHTIDTGATCEDGDPCTSNDTCDANGVCVGGGPTDCHDANTCTVDSCDSELGCIHTPDLGASCDDGSVCTDGDTCGLNGACIGGAPVDCDDVNACTIDDCDAVLGCTHTPDVGASCSDGNLCTDGDTCSVDGSCAGGPPTDCDDANDCTIDTCDPADGCRHTPDAGASCEDGDLCSDGDMCDASGACVGGSPTDCDDGNGCTIDGCDPVQGCTHAPDVGASCDDADVCTIDDACNSAGACVGGALDCDDANTCTIDGCDPIQGCTHTPDIGASCEDGNACTDGDICDAVGVCITGTPTDCNDANGCTIDGCDPDQGCTHVPDIGASCNDGDACTDGDSCDAGGACVGDAPVDCSDLNSCTIDTCDPTQGCANIPDVGASCSDGNLCTDADTCDADGICVGGAPTNCDDGDPCTADSCDPILGCIHMPDVGASCDDGDLCTDGDACDASGICVGGAPTDCDDSDVCTIDGCDPALGCTHVPDAGASCDDGNVCTDGDTCDGGGTCVGGAPVDCDDANSCTTDGCDPVQGCTHIPDVGASCDDGDLCSDDDACNAEGACIGGAPVDCDDANSCTTDDCDPALGCTHVPDIGASCEDGNLCSGGDTCDAEGACIGGALVDCDDANTCTTDDCDPALGCTHVPDIGAGCDDGDLCSDGDACDAAGTCVGGAPTDCDDANTCTIDDCDPEQGCSHTPDVGAGCEDGDACTEGDTCDTEGACAGGTPLDCDDANSCTVDGCDPVEGCSHAPDVGASCDDDNICTDGDICDGNGACIGGAPLDCSDGDPCTVDSCDPVLGCTYTIDVGAPCEDGSACTVDDTCDATGACIGGAPANCDDANSCTVDGCDPVQGCVHTPDAGASCDDGDVCTEGDTCDAIGDCVGGSLLDCADSDPCTADTCDSVLGCVHTPDVGASCDDGDPCTEADACDAAGACIGGGPTNCDDANDCSIDSCDPILGCTHTPAEPGVTCDDGLDCTANEYCFSGRCIGDDLCPDGELCGTAGTCEELTGDELPISAGESWRYFEGTQEPPPDWNTRTFQHSSWLEGPSGFGYGDDDDATILPDMQDNYVSVYVRHLFEVPDPAALYGVTLSVNYDDAFVAYINGTEVARSDNIVGMPPLYSDEATSGHEAGTPEFFSLDSQLGLFVSGVNALALQGHNRSPGSSDFSLIPGLTINCAIPGVPCEDGSACTQNDSCDANGDCIPGPLVDCDDSDVCTVDTCDPVLGCVNDPGVSCDDGNECTIDACDSDLGCSNTPDVGTSCDDGDACTTEDSCDVTGTCVGTPAEPSPEVQQVTLEGSVTTTISWPDQGPNLFYDVASGTVSELGADGGILGAQCLQDDEAGSSYVDSRPAPAAGDAYYYVIRSQDECSTSSYGSDSSGNERVPTNDCP